MANKTIASALNFEVKTTTLVSKCRFFPVPYFCDHDSIKWKTLTFNDSITYTAEEVKNPIIQGVIGMAMHNKGKAAIIKSEVSDDDPRPMPEPEEDNIPEAPITEISDNTVDSGVPEVNTPDESQPEIAEPGTSTVEVETPAASSDDTADANTSE